MKSAYTLYVIGIIDIEVVLHYVTHTGEEPAGRRAVRRSSRSVEAAERGHCASASCSSRCATSLLPFRKNLPGKVVFR